MNTCSSIEEMVIYMTRKLFWNVFFTRREKVGHVICMYFVCIHNTCTYLNILQLWVTVLGKQLHVRVP